MPTSADIAKQLATYDANKKSSADVLNEAMSQYGVPEIRKRVAGLRTTLSNTETALNNVDPSVTGRTSRSLVTEAQRQRIVNKEREPIAAQYGDESRSLANESANLSDQSAAAQLLAKGQMDDYTIGRNALQQQYNDTVTSENEVRRRAEADRAFKLQQQQEARAKTESDRNYQLAVKQAATKNNNNNSSKKVTVSDLFDGYVPGRDKFYTENVVIPTLISQGMSSKKAQDTAYAYRKATFGK